VDSIAKLLSKLFRETAHLKDETIGLAQSLASFKKKHPLPKPTQMPYGQRVRRESEPVTDAPRSAIQEIHYEFRDGANLDVPTRVLKPVAI
jgi:hypothetical protein